MSEDKNKGGLTAGLNKKDQKRFSEFLKSQVSSKEDSVKLSKEEQLQMSRVADLQDRIALKNSEILKLAETHLKSTTKMKDLQDKIKKSIDEQADTEKKLFTSNKLVLLKKKKIAELEKESGYANEFLVALLKKEVKEEEKRQKSLEVQLYQIDNYISSTEELLDLERDKTKELAVQVAQRKIGLGILEDELSAADAALQQAQEHTKTLHKAVDAAEELVEKYEEVFEPFEEIDAWMQKIPGGGLMSKALGLDGIGDKIKKQIVDRIAAGEVAGKGMVASLGPLIPLLIAAGLLMKAFEFDKELTQFSKDLDVSKGSALEASNHADHLATHLGMANVTGKEMGASMVALKEEFGDIASTNDKLVEGVTMLRERMGLTNEEAISLNSTATLLGTNLDELSASSMKMSEGLIGGKQMLKEMSKLPKSILVGFKGTTKELQKAVVKGKLLGLELSKVQSIGDGLLDIETSIEKEMTANVLTGKHMNLNKARQLYLTGNIAGLQQELLDQAGGLDEYQKMGPLQQRVMAEAMSMTREEMTEMLVKAQELKDVGLDQTKIEEVLAANGAERDKMMSSMDAKQQGYLQKLIEQKNQEEATAKIQTAMNRLMEAFSKSMLPVVDLLGEILGYIGILVDYITKAVEYVNHFVHELSGATEPLKEGEGIMSKILKYTIGIGAAMLAWNVGKKALGGLKSMIPGMGGGKTPETPDTSKMDKAKGKGSEGGLTSLAGGLKAMGQSGVGKGILNTAMAGPALLLSLPSIPFLAFIGKVKLDKLEENFTGLGNGLKAMDGTLKGSLATGAFGIAGGIAVVSIPFLLIFGKVKLDKLQENFTALGTGLQSMSGTMMGSAGLGAFALAGALAIPSLIFLGIFGKVSFDSLIPNFTGLATGLELMSATLLGSAALAAFGLAAIIALPSLIFLGGIALLGEVASAGLIALGTGLEVLGGIAATGLPFIAVALIGALGLAMIPFGIALAKSAPGLKAFADILSAVGPIITATFEGIGTVIEKISGGIALIITTITQSIQGLANLNPAKLLGVAGGIAAVGFAVAGFGAGAGAGGVMSAIGSFFDEDPVEKFNRFAAIDAGKLAEVASAIDKLGNAIANFSSQVGKIGEVSGIVSTIDKVMELHDAVTKNPIEEAIEGVGNAVGDIFSKAASFITSIPTADTVNTSGVATSTDSATSAKGQGSLAEVAKLLKELIAKVDQPVSININGRVMDEIEKQTTLRKTYSTKVDGGYGTFG